MNVKFDFHCLYSRRLLFFISLLFIVALVSSCFVSAFNNVSPFVSGAPDKVISNETELRNAVNNAVGPTVIAFDKDITLTSATLSIPANKNITLTSNNKNEFYKLIGAPGKNTITIESSGVLKLDGIIITHINGATGSGVHIRVSGTLIMVDGEISGNTALSNYDFMWPDEAYMRLGGGVLTEYGGTFSMFGGIISNNTAEAGGGVLIFRGRFSMFGGIISNNTATDSGGGVNNNGNFSMYGGEISSNTADRYGGGVNTHNGDFNMSGGVIFNNTVSNGGGVCVSSIGNFSMFGGTISNNTAKSYGGGIYGVNSFIMHRGTISNNTANYGGGIFNINSFNMPGGTISNNTANYGGGIYNSISGTFKMADGEISGNTALGGPSGGGGVYNEGLFELFGGVISKNKANTIGGGVHNRGNFNLYAGTIFGNTATDNGGGVQNNGNFTLFFNGEISNNKVTNGNGGGVYTHNGNFSMRGGVISGNTASRNGGGIYISDSGNLNLFSGMIANNTATNSGGGVGVTDIESLKIVYVSDGVVFSNNRASVAYNRAYTHDSLYNSHIGNRVTWSEPFTQGYNNYDISYTYGTLFSYSVTVHGSYTASSGTGSYIVGETVTINAGTRNGYDFSGWTVTEGGVTLPNSPSVTFTMPANNVVLSTNWVPTSSGGNSNGSTPSNPPSSSPFPSNSPYNPEPSTPLFSPEQSVDNTESNLGGYLILTVTSLTLTISLVAVALFFYSKKRQK